MNIPRIVPAPPVDAGAVPLLGAHSARLWYAQSPLEARARQGAAALAALSTVLRERGPQTPTQTAFLAFYDAALRAPPADFTAVWTAPAAYYLTHLAYQFLGHTLTGAALSPQAQDDLGARGHTSADAALEDVLERFGAFHLALAARTGAAVRLPRPLSVPSVWCLPGTPWLLEAGGAVQLTAAADGCIEGLCDGAAFASVPGHAGPLPGAAERWRRAVQAGAGAWCADLNPHALADLPGLAFTAPVRAAGEAFHARHADLVSAAAQAVAAHQPHSLAQLAASLRVLALKPMDAGDYTNMTYSDLPGCAIVAVVEDPLDLADTLIHELHHNRLFGLEAGGPFLDPAADAGAVHYSPWRGDPRPLYGLLHAVYVHVPVWHYWRAVWQAGSGSAAQRAYAADRLVRYAGQLARGVEGLAGAPFTDAGRALYEELQGQTAHVAACLPALGVPPDPPALVCRADGTIAPQRGPGGEALSVRAALQAHLRAMPV